MDLLIEGLEQGPVRSEYDQRRTSFGTRQPKSDLGRLHDLFGFGPRHLHAAAANEAQHPLHAQTTDPVRIGQVADQHPQRRRVEAMGETAGQPREDQVELPVDLVA